MKTYIKPSVEVVETEVEQLIAVSTVSTPASSSYDCLDKGEKDWTDSSSFWGE